MLIIVGFSRATFPRSFAAHSSKSGCSLTIRSQSGWHWSHPIAEAPFTERVATYALRAERGELFVAAKPNPIGTKTAPLVLP